MAVIRTDGRRIEASPHADDDRDCRADAAAAMEIKIRQARRLLRMERRGQFHLFACSSIVHYGVSIGMPAAEVRWLMGLARALAASEALVAAHAAADAAAPREPVEARVRSGKLHPDNASLIGKLFEDGSLVRDGEDWLGLAQSLPTRELRARVRERLEEAATGRRPLVSLTLHVTERTCDAFARARVLASREARTTLSEGQTFAAVVEHYLDGKDELRRGSSERRVGPTSERPRDRYIPAAVRRAVLERSGDRCEVPGCAHRIYLEFAHLVPHRARGSREEDNLVRLCRTHHVQMDAGLLQWTRRPSGPPAGAGSRSEREPADAFP
jgi:5-methylcytosine-specific restriction endonuclease McrA